MDNPSGRPDRVDAPPYSCAVINYNGADYVLRTLASILSQEPPPAEVILVDDGSTDGGPDLVAAAYPDVRIVRLPQNTGRTSVVRNAGLAAARHRFVLISDNDVTFAPEAVHRMQAVLAERADAAACTPVVLFDDGSGQICNRSHNLHFLCWSQDSSMDHATLRARGPVRGIGCGIQLLDRDRLGEVGGYDEDFVIGWGDDGELHHRMMIAGRACYSVPDAVVYHARIRGTPRYYGQIRNRLLILFKMYRLRTLILLAPLLIPFEAVLIGFLWIAGGLGDYGRAVRDVWGLRRGIGADRRRIAATRRVGDGRVLHAGRLTVPVRRSGPALRRLVRGASRVLAGYWCAVGRFA
ncbi:glycosyltransferase family 2 protein [Jannaschia rubra]|uniref:Putative glycosyltransferase EpsH n=1 Tax=Jannaschia rubra TaxID=282197 RepID=A0A0M6XM40_9RHOB|nr:glycosyltransferase [Jannaschia rubra]CTQ31253.1 Putative glycosyltransferase EpsH [Jannaschia rubra]SFF89931.1 Glycosyl transferase family 2 [Jannaschia rubra]